MARGVCVIGSRVGGIVELADSECLFAPDDEKALAECVARLYSDAVHTTALAQAGQARARAVVEQARPERISAFLRSVALVPE